MRAKSIQWPSLNISTAIPVKPGEEKTKPVIEWSYPYRVENKDTKVKEFDKFVKLFKKLEINIPFFEALEKMPLYQKFMKEVL